MKRKGIAKFSKVSFEQFLEDYRKLGTVCADEKDISEKGIKALYDNIKLPKRATKGSAGYDFVTPSYVCLPPGESVTIPTGIRCRIDEGWELDILPKSGLGCKYRIQLDNTIGLIDSDYYNALNEGHILVKISNNQGKDGKILTLGEGDKF